MYVKFQDQKINYKKIIQNLLTLVVVKIVMGCGIEDRTTSCSVNVS